MFTYGDLYRTLLVIMTILCFNVSLKQHLSSVTILKTHMKKNKMCF